MGGCSVHRRIGATRLAIFLRPKLLGIAAIPINQPAYVCEQKAHRWGIIGGSRRIQPCLPPDIAFWLQQQRTARRLSQAEVAALIGISQATISTWERGKSQPDDVQIDRLRVIFDGLAEPQRDAPPAPIEGVDSATAAGWGDDYPLDAVFVRTDQRTAGEVVKRIRLKRYDLNPDFQRDFVWPIEKQSRLIESCIMRIPLPVFYVAEAPDGRIIVVDGLQRLSTFDRYLNDEFKLAFSKSEDGTTHPLEGKRFKNLDLKLQERIEDTQLTLYILDSKAPERAKLDIFERVNSGEPLTRQQMRNCLYNGPATVWLKDAQRVRRFRGGDWGITRRVWVRDREALNRFCAFSIIGWTEYKSGDMDSFLAEALKRMNRMDHGGAGMHYGIASIVPSASTLFSSEGILFANHWQAKALGTGPY